MVYERCPRSANKSSKHCAGAGVAICLPSSLRDQRDSHLNAKDFLAKAEKRMHLGLKFLLSELAERERRRCNYHCGGKRVLGIVAGGSSIDTLQDKPKTKKLDIEHRRIIHDIEKPSLQWNCITVRRVSHFFYYSCMVHEL